MTRDISARAHAKWYLSSRERGLLLEREKAGRGESREQQEREDERCRGTFSEKKRNYAQVQAQLEFNAHLKM